ncbi:unnamed protein product [Closterium sp. NIES-65]|nr:unnamed protein product [Closterium sp. NIES-65]
MSHFPFPLGLSSPFPQVALPLPFRLHFPFPLGLSSPFPHVALPLCFRSHFPFPLRLSSLFPQVALPLPFRSHFPFPLGLSSPFPQVALPLRFRLFQGWFQGARALLSFPSRLCDKLAALSALQERDSARAATCRAELRNALQHIAGGKRQRRTARRCRRRWC